MAKRKANGIREPDTEIRDVDSDVEHDPTKKTDNAVEDSSQTLQVDYDIPPTPPIRRRRKRKARTIDNNDTVQLVVNVLDVVGHVLAGDAGKLNPTERTLIETGLAKLEFSEQVVKWSYPVIGLLGVSMWALRVYNIRSALRKSNEPHSQPTESQPQTDDRESRIIPVDPRLHTAISVPV